MNWQKIVAPVLCVALLGVGWRAYGWSGVAFVVTGIVMWMLLHFNRLVHVMKKVADRPKGYVGSAVMLHAKLKQKVNLLHVMAMTESLGEPLSPEGEQPEVYRWTDPSDSSVTCEFVDGRLVKWTLHRPQAEAEAPTSLTP